MSIPKIFHWVWIGSNPIPKNDQDWIRSWLNENPYWTGMLWTDSPSTAKVAHKRLEVNPLPPIVNSELYHSIRKYVAGDEKCATAARSDIIRYEVVMRNGGIYLDTDVEAFQPVYDMFDHVDLFYSDEYGSCNGNYMFGARPYHPAIVTLVRELTPHARSLPKPENACIVTGPAYLGPRLRAHSDCVIWPHMLFNPLCADDDHTQVTKWPEATIANHHFDGKWYNRVKRTPPKEFMEGS